MCMTESLFFLHTETTIITDEHQLHFPVLFNYEIPVGSF